MKEYGNVAMKGFTPHVVLEIYTFLNQTFLEGKDILNFLKALQQCFNLSQALLTFAYFLSFEESLGKTSRDWYVKTGSDSCISASPAAPAELSEHSSGLCLKSTLWPGVKLLTLSLPQFSNLKTQPIMLPFFCVMSCLQRPSASREGLCYKAVFVLCLQHRAEIPLKALGVLGSRPRFR